MSNQEAYGYAVARIRAKDVDYQSVNVMILLPERTFGNDCVFTRLAESDQIKILL